MFVCQYCNKELTTKTVLRTHQENAKYCLLKQNKTVQNNIRCEFCDKEFSTKSRKETHEVKCKVRITNETNMKLSSLKTINECFKDEIERLKNTDKSLNEEIEKLQNKIDQLKEENERLKLDKERQRSEIYVELYKNDQQFILEQSKRLVDKTSTTTNIRGKTINMNALNLSQERLYSIKDTYTLKHYEQGGIGQADWVVENVLKDESGNIVYKCTDKNRKNFIYQDDKGNIITDIHAKKLKEAILPMIEIKLKEYKKVKYSELADVSDDESELLEKCNVLYKENKELGPEFDKRLIEKTYT